MAILSCMWRGTGVSHWEINGGQPGGTGTGCLLRARARESAIAAYAFSEAQKEAEGWESFVAEKGRLGCAPTGGCGCGEAGGGDQKWGTQCHLLGNIFGFLWLSLSWKKETKIRRAVGD